MNDYTNKIKQENDTITLDLTNGIGNFKNGSIYDELADELLELQFVECFPFCELMIKDFDGKWFMIEHKYHYSMNLNELDGYKVDFIKVTDENDLIALDEY